VLLEYATTGPVRAVVERRLAHAQLSARVSDAEGTLTVRLPEATEASSVKRLLARSGRFELCAEQVDDQRRWCAVTAGAGLRVTAVGEDAGCLLEADAAAPLDALLDEQAPPIGRVLRARHGATLTAHSGAECVSPHLVAGTLRAGGASLTWDAVGALEVATLTTRLASSGGRLLLAFDDEVLTLVVHEPITGTRCEVPEVSPDDAALQLAAVLGGELEGLTLLRETTWGPPRLR
jgi:hypothetical protein